MANVRPSAVSNWRSRANKHFPSPVDSKDGRPLFDYDQVSAWLKGNGIEFKDTRTEQAVWSFFEQWREQNDPVAMASVLLWALAFGKSACEAELSKEWKALASGKWDVPDGPGANDRSISENDELAKRCRDLVRAILRKSDDDHDSALHMALDPTDSASLTPTKLADLLRFADGILSLGDGEADRLASMVLARSITGNGRMYDAAGLPNAPVSVLLARLAMSYVRNGVTDSPNTVSVYDPACGILECSLRFGAMLRNESADAPIVFHCADINPHTATIAARRFLLAGLPSSTMRLNRQNTLAQDPFPDLRADVAVVEPPFGTRWENDVMDPRWRYGVPPKIDASLAWVEDAVAHLSERGRAFVVTSEGPLYRPMPAEASIRRALVAAGCVEAIISLPGNLYVGTSIPTAVWVLSAPDPTRDSVAMVSTSADPAEYVSTDDAPSWMRDVVNTFSHNRTTTRIVRSVDILGTDTVPLLPEEWLERNVPNPNAIAESYRAKQGLLTESRTRVDDALRVIDDFDACGFDCSEAVTVPLSDIATIRRNGVAASRKHESPSGGIEVTATDVRNHTFRTGTTSDGDAAVTRPGDVLFTAVGTISAMADVEGRHFVSANVHVARLKNDRWNPEYVALMIESEWNARSMKGVVKRMRPTDVEIPMLPLEQQNRLVAYAHAVESLQRQTELCRDQLDTLASAARYNAVIGTVGKDSTENGE